MKKILIVCLVAVLAVGLAASADAAKKRAGFNFWDKSTLATGAWNALVLDGTKMFAGGAITFNAGFGTAFGITALNQANGNYLWNIPAQAPVYRGGGVFTADGDLAGADSCLAVATFGNKVYGAGRVNSVAGGDGYTVFALNQASGNVAWSYLEDFDNPLFPCAAQADEARTVATGFDFFFAPWVITAGLTTTNCLPGLNLGTQFSVRAFDPNFVFAPLTDDFNFPGAAAGAADRANVMVHDNFTGFTYVGGLCTQTVANGGAQACVRAYDLSAGFSPIPAPILWTGGFSDPIGFPLADAGALAALTATAEINPACATCNAEVLSMTLGFDYSFGFAIPAIFAVGYAEFFDPVSTLKHEQLMVWAIDQTFGFTLWTYFFDVDEWLSGPPPFFLQDRALSVTFRDPVIYIGGFGVSDFFNGAQAGVVIALDTTFGVPFPYFNERWVRVFNRQGDLADSINSVNVQAGGAIVAAGGFQNTTQPGFAGPGAYFALFGLDTATGATRFKPATTQRRAGIVANNTGIKIRGNTIYAVGVNGATAAARAYWTR